MPNNIYDSKLPRISKQVVRLIRLVYLCIKYNGNFQSIYK